MTETPRRGHAARPAEGTVTVWGLPLAPLTSAQVLDAVDGMVARRRPEFLVTANLNYAMLSRKHPGLRRANRKAALVLADGMPLVWASRLTGRPLPERVTGSDLTPALCARAAERGYRVFLYGGAEGVAEQAAARLKARHPALEIVGAESPPFRDLTPDEIDALECRIRAARPDLLFVATGQPKGEIFLLDHAERLGVPVSMQIGATLDFIAGRVPRAPGWLGKLGLEWVYRLAREPRRLSGRYARNIAFLAREITRSLGSTLKRRPLPSIPRTID